MKMAFTGFLNEMNLLFYVLASILIAIAFAYFLPRPAVIVGSFLLLSGLLSIGSCVYHEFVITVPHDTSAYGMMATISALTVIPMGVVMIVAGFIGKRRRIGRE